MTYQTPISLNLEAFKKKYDPERREIKFLGFERLLMSKRFR